MGKLLVASLAVAMAGLLPLAAGPAFAQPASPRRGEAAVSAGSQLTVEVGSGRVIGLGRQATSVFAADPKIAEVRPASATSLFVFGVGTGRTTIAAMDAAGNPIAQYDVIVRPSSYAAQEASGAIARDLPNSRVTTQPRLNGLSVNGMVQSPLDAQRAIGSARMSLPDKQKLQATLGVRSSIQVNLHVRVAEMSRNLTRALGVDWTLLGGNIGRLGVAAATHTFIAPGALTASTLGIGGAWGKTSFEAFLDALSQDQLVHMLAEPNLTTMSGEPASFNVGGEFPIPVAQQNNVLSVEFKQFGISLAFVPTVLDDGQINLHVRPEVSELSDQGAVQLAAGNSSIAIPALSVRRADTTVTVGSGQSVAIAGLLSDTVRHTTQAVPLLGEIPVLGALFRSDSFIRNETELVIVVTPYIVNPQSEAAALQLPTDGYKPPGDFDRIVLLRQNARDGGRLAPPMAGSAGFVLQ